MRAQQFTNSVEIAKYRGSPIDEKSGSLNLTLAWENDVHFGINSHKFDRDVTNPGLWGLGPRILDIRNRGGRTAEEAYRFVGEGGIPLFCAGCRRPLKNPKGNTIRHKARELILLLNRIETENSILYDNIEKYMVEGNWFVASGFPSQYNCPRCNRKDTLVAFSCRSDESLETIIRDINEIGGPMWQKNRSHKIRGRSRLHPNRTYHAKMSGESIQGQCRPNSGVVWSKAALENVYNHKDSDARAHFHLDGLGDIYDILDKQGDWSHNVTGRELRFIWRHWDRFQHCVHFYNGYDASKKVVEVEVPWSDIGGGDTYSSSA